MKRWPSSSGGGATTRTLASGGGGAGKDASAAMAPANGEKVREGLAGAVAGAGDAGDAGGAALCGLRAGEGARPAAVERISARLKP